MPLSQNATSPSPDAEEQNRPSLQQLMQVLRKPRDEVYELSADGSRYFMPHILRGTLIAKLTEDSPYWEPSWESLDDFLAKESEEEALKDMYMTRLKVDPDSKEFQKKAKVHQDNVSKHRKIREMFGPDSDYHPNQLVSKRHLPDGGLCKMELMYHLACKLSDLRVLQARGDLAMDPWDFIRWHIGRMLQQKRLDHPGKTAKDFICSFVRSLGNKCTLSDPYADPIMREAVLRSAGYQNRLNSFKTRDSRPSGASSANTGRGRQTSAQSRQRSRVQTAAEAAANDALARQARRDRRARLEQQARLGQANPGTAYQGVNAYRAESQAKAGEGALVARRGLARRGSAQRSACISRARAASHEASSRGSSCEPDETMRSD